MELTPFWIYVVMQAPAFVAIFGVGAAISAVITIFYILLYGDDIIGNYESDREKIVVGKRVIRRWAITAACLFITAVSFPQTKTLVAMWGLPAVIQQAKGLKLDETGVKAVNALNRWLDTTAQEAKEN